MVKSTSRQSTRRNSILQVLALGLVLVLLNVISTFFFARFDLTSEKRYSLSPETKTTLKNLRDVVYVKVYLDGDLPPSYKRLRDAVREMLDEFRAVAGDNVEYEFIDPSASPDAKERNQLYEQLTRKGIQYTNIQERGKGETTQKIIFPGAVLNYLGKEMSMQFLKSRIGTGTEEMVNSSAEGLEYEFMNALRKSAMASRKKVAFLQGHGELNTMQLTDAARSLADACDIDTVILRGNLSALKNYQVVVIAKPLTPFEERDKFIIDQYIMNGGKVLWLIDQMRIDMDSLSASNTNIAVAADVNLDDLLFKYGVRLNYNLVTDLQAAPIPVVTGYVGNQPQQNLFPWYFYPLINPLSAHPIVHNLNAVKLEFAGTIDTVEAEGIRKTVLLQTSRYTKDYVAPVRVSLNILQEEPDPKQYTSGELPVAVLLEGRFHSGFRNRIPEAIAQSPDIHYQEQGKPTRMIVVSDGDVIASFVSKKGKVFPLGYDRFTGETYGNRNFFLNCMDYLLDDSGLMTLRTKEFRIRLLDKSRSDVPWVKWLNLWLPVGLVAAFGLMRYLVRRKKYLA